MVQAQSAAVSLNIKKAEVLSNEDVKSLLVKAFPDKDLSSYSIRGFNLVGNATKIESGNITTLTVVETASCGTWTQNQRAFINENGAVGSVFILESITVMRRGESGTPYTEEDDKIFSLPNISFTIAE